jgi:hypothetical protein
VSKENSLRHFLNILFSEGDNELDGSEDPESVVGPAALLLLIGVTGVEIERASAESRQSRQRLQRHHRHTVQLFYVPTQTITEKRNMRTVKLVVIGNSGVGKTSLRGQVR